MVGLPEVDPLFGPRNTEFKLGFPGLPAERVVVGSDGKGYYTDDHYSSYPIELHHVDRTPDSDLNPLSRTDHRLGDNYKKNHP